MHFNTNIESFLNHDYYDLSRGKYADFKKLAGNGLLISIGESWTWGVDLPENRLEKVWGRRLADQLKYDWLNIARPGASNIWIAYQLQELNRWLEAGYHIPYDKIIISVCWTETGRELTENWDWVDFDPSKKFNNIDFKNKTITDLVRILNNNVIILTNTQCTRLSDAGVQYEFWPHHNFCSPTYWTHSWKTPPKNWINIISENVGLPYNSVPAFVSDYLLSRAKNKLDLTLEIMNEIDWLLDQANACLLFLNSSQWNRKAPLKHPSEEAHNAWAKYIFDFFR